MIAGLDIGYGQVKACVKFEDRIVKSGFPRILAEAGDPDWKELNRSDTYAIGGERWVIGNQALSFSRNIVRRESQDYVLENSYWACLGKALIDSGYFRNGNTPIRMRRIVLGIAPGHYQKSTIRKMKKKIRTGVEMYWNGKEIRFSAEKANILPQGAGAFFDWILSDDGKAKNQNETDQLFGILDIGYRTTDYVIFDGTNFIADNELSEDTGVRMILNKLLEVVTKRYDYREKKLEYIEPVLRGEPFFYRGEEIDLSLEVKLMVQDHLKRRIEPDLKKRWEDRMDRMRKIIVCGGGAWLLKMVPDFLKDHEKQIVVPSEPEFSNARGFYRFAAMNERKTARES